MGDSLPWTPMNRRAKFDAAIFIFGREIRNCTNKQTNKQKTHKQYTIYPHLAHRHVWMINGRPRSRICSLRYMLECWSQTGYPAVQLVTARTCFD